MNNIFTLAFFETWLVAAFRLSGPILLVALGETIGQNTGVLNLGIEGAMLGGALTAFAVTFSLGSPTLGILAAILCGLVLGLFLSWVYITANVNQVVAGVVFNAFMMAAASYVYRYIYGNSPEIQRVTGFSPIHIPYLSEIPIMGPALFEQSLLLYLAFVLVAVSWFALFKTTLGLKILGVGENPRSAEASGISVNKTRYFGVLYSSALAGFGGGYLMLTAINSYRDGITAGKGFIALAIVIFGGWNPVRVACAAIIFGAADALQLSLQSAGIPVIPQLLFALPYILTIFAVSGIFGSRSQPTSLLIKYER